MWWSGKGPYGHRRRLATTAMFFGNVQVKREELPDVFADFFENKVKNIVENIQVATCCILNLPQDTFKVHCKRLLLEGTG